MSDRNRPVVSARWLMEHVHDPLLRIIDASWHMPASNQDARAEYQEAHIPGAIYFDIDEHSAQSHLPHTLPASTDFTQAMGVLGISASHKIVVYDTAGLFSAARVWWMFRHYGASDVLVLDGGLPAWREAGGELVSGTSDLPACDFNPDAFAGKAIDADAVLESSQNGTSLILDARSYKRFTGEEKEPRKGLRSGHIPGSRSLPFTDLLTKGQLKSNAELQQIFDALAVSQDSSIITTCGSGVTAAVISLALYCVGIDDVALYDGSWSEWGSRDELPVSQGGVS